MPKGIGRKTAAQPVNPSYLRTPHNDAMQKELTEKNDGGPGKT
jgi:hypothetical protein